MVQTEKLITYFEAGKLTTIASKNFIILSAVLIIFSMIESEPKLELPFLKLTLDYALALSVLFLIHSFTFYKFIAAVTYERLLKYCLIDELQLSGEDIWRLSYPNYFNFVQNSNVFAKGTWGKVILISVMLIAFPSVFLIPMIGVFSAFKYFSIFSAILLFLSVAIYVCGFLLTSNFKVMK